MEDEAKECSGKGCSTFTFFMRDGKPLCRDCTKQINNYVTGEEMVEAISNYLAENPNISLSHSMDVGYWNSLKATLAMCGFKIVRK